MKLGVVLVCIAACGGTQSGQRIDTREKFVAWHQGYMKKQLASCNAGNQDDCLGHAIDLMQRFHLKEHPEWEDDTYPLDVAKAKQMIWSYCTAPSVTNPTSCFTLAEQATLTYDEVDKLCTADEWCSHYASKAKLDDGQLRDLCFAHPSSCLVVQPRLKDPETAADVKPMAEFGSILMLASQRVAEHKAAAQQSEDEDQDDSADKCHKDTDCKGDRICQKGSCVDPGAPKPKAAPPKKLATGETRCDWMVDLVQQRMEACDVFQNDGAELEQHVAAAVSAYSNAPHKDKLGTACSKVYGQTNAEVDTTCPKK